MLSAIIMCAGFLYLGLYFTFSIAYLNTRMDELESKSGKKE